MKTTQSKYAFFQKFALFLFIYTLLVILWGAWVRISHSGDGCGDTWPLCNGQLIPEAQQGKTWVEFTHRIMSGIYGFVVIGFWLYARKLFPKKHPARRFALLTLVFTISEALLGAKLVIFGLVTNNDTPYRAFIMALHMINSFLLTGMIALAHVAVQDVVKTTKTVKSSLKQFLFPALIVLIGITGAWASLSNSLFPTENLWQGLAEDFSTESHFLVRLRILHPILATLGAGGLGLFFYLKSQTEENKYSRQKSLRLAVMFFVAIGFGYATLFMHAPVWMKITHLTFAHTIWALLLQWLYPVRNNSEDLRIR